MVLEIRLENFFSIKNEISLDFRAEPHKDFRENMDAEKGYLQGRFDAIPIVDNSAAALKKLLGNTETV